MVVDEAERKLDKLEGFIGRDEEDVCLIFEEDGSRMVCAGVRREPVTTVAKLDTSGHSVRSRKMGSNDGDSVVESKISSNVLYK